MGYWLLLGFRTIDLVYLVARLAALVVNRYCVRGSAHYASRKTRAGFTPSLALFGRFLAEKRVKEEACNEDGRKP